ncbi:MAG TPA: peptidoglycan editing factor PgeF [Ramlibacter sp.]|nr:peptidoglycan editing factor PgeF [Ramlibacter sp.]
MSLPPEALLLPVWPAPATVRAVCSTRAGGVSRPPFDSLNLGDHVGDDPTAVAMNRSRLAEALGVRPVFLRQVHGAQTVLIDAGTPDGSEADGCVTTLRGVACTIMVADCLPILLCDDAGRVVAAGHAGWRGLAGGSHAGGASAGVVESMFARFAAAAGAAPEAAAARTVAWLGPCIGPEAFEVGSEVKAAFEAADPGAAAHFRPGAPGKWLADLPGLARRRLNALGVRSVHGNDGSAQWCTVANPSSFFSHRRDGRSGRFAASIWLA